MDGKNVLVPKQELDKQKEFSKMVKSILSTKFVSSHPKAFTHTYGCQGNVSDGQRINGMLEEMGYEFTQDVSQADLVLYNTCAIREHAEDRVFGNVGELKHLKESNPDAIIALCGCMMQQKHIAEKIQKSYSYVDLIFGTHVLHKLPEFIYNLLCNKKRLVDITDSEGVIAEGIAHRRDSKIKAFLPIAYGCNNFCSYCVVPYVRGRERSRAFDDVLNEAKQLVKDGYKEINLLGQNVNSYGNDFGEQNLFSKLLKSINAIEGDFLIRFMTSHPKDCTKELLETMSQCEKLERHLHLPFQSGNNRVLKEMNRCYTREHYLELVEIARKLMPDISLTSDVIVGFPGETYEEFCETLSLVEQVGFSSLYTFIYSKREGTNAAQIPDNIPRSEKSKWFTELTDLQERIADERSAKMKDKVYRVLAEGVSKTGMITGRTSGNVIVEFEASNSVIGNFCNVEATEPLTWIVRGKII
ncbi:MAG: tRNA (N6-isopentenyl adenosine(37)-C2)-methylthiotransferase MiaB [Oscillospiraceae bacterium]